MSDVQCVCYTVHCTRDQVGFVLEVTHGMGDVRTERTSHGFQKIIIITM